jgi:hypothetical protein
MFRSWDRIPASDVHWNDAVCDLKILVIVNFGGKNVIFLKDSCTHHFETVDGIAEFGGRPWL